MRIKELNATNFKGHDTHAKLSSVNLIIAGNFTGKTSIADAIRFGLFGHVPRYGKENGVLAEAFGDSCAVELAYDSGERNAVKIFRNEDGGISKKANISVDIPETLLDIATYFDKSKNERLGYIFSLTAPAAQDFVALNKLEVKLGNAMETELSALQRKFIDGLDGKTIKSCIDALTKSRPKDIANTMLAVSQSLDRLEKMERDESKRLLAALPTIRQRITECTYKDQSAALETARKELAKLRGDLDRLENDDEELSRQQQKRSDLEAEATAGKEAIKRKKVIESQLKKLSPKVSEFLQSDLDAANAEYLANEKQILRLTKLLDDIKSGKNDHPHCPVCFCEGPQLIKGLASALKQAKEAFSLSERHLSTLNESKSFIGQSDALKDELASVTQMIADGNAASELIKGMSGGKSKSKTTAINLSRAEVESKRNLVELLERQQGLFNQSKADRDSLIKNEELAMIAQAKQSCYKLVIKILAYERQQIVNDSIQGLLKVAHRFTDGILFSNLEYNEKGELGRRVSQLDKDAGNQAAIGTWIPSIAFSGTEEMLALAGFAVALSAQSSFKLVIMDELGRVELSKKKEIIQRMNQLVKEKVIDQFIGIDVSETGYDLQAKDKVCILKL